MGLFDDTLTYVTTDDKLQESTLHNMLKAFSSINMKIFF